MSQTKVTKQINNLWERMEDSISEAYRLAYESNNNNGMHLDDYARDVNHARALDRLLQAEMASERQHRRQRPDNGYKPFPFPVETGAKLLLMEAFADGSEDVGMPSAMIFISWNKIRAEAHTIGYLCKGFVPQIWRDEVRKFDYAAMMTAKDSTE